MNWFYGAAVATFHALVCMCVCVGVCVWANEKIFTRAPMQENAFDFQWNEVKFVTVSLSSLIHFRCHSLRHMQNIV